MARATKKSTPESAPVSAPDTSIREMALSIFDKVRAIKRENPEVARQIDRVEKEIRDKLVSIRQEVDKLPRKEDRELVTVLVVNGLHRTADEVLVD